VTFHLVCLGWVFFRATSFANVGQVLGRLFAGGRHVHLDVMVVAVVVASLAVQWFPTRWSTRLQRTFVRWSIPAQALALAGVVVVIDAFGPAGVAPFIYFRF
jgi:predicted Co/Zn/Cd cation transporter (cation efflux family)